MLEEWFAEARWLVVRKRRGLLLYPPGEVSTMRLCQALGVSPVVAGFRGRHPYRYRRRWRGRPVR